MCKHRGVFATGCSNGDTLTRLVEVVADDGVVYLVFERSVKALSAQLLERLGALEDSTCSFAAATVLDGHSDVCAWLLG